MNDAQFDRRRALAQRQAQAVDVGAAEHVHRRVAGRIVGIGLAGAAFAVKKALDIGQEGNELAVMALPELFRIGREFVVDPPPGMGFPARLEDFPVPPAAARGRQRLELQRPDQVGVEQAHAADVADFRWSRHEHPPSVGLPQSGPRRRHALPSRQHPFLFTAPSSKVNIPVVQAKRIYYRPLDVAWKGGTPARDGIAVTITLRGKVMHARQAMPALTVAAIGVVFGDIGTSPLYALKEIFNGHHPIPVTPDNILGVLSLVFWAIMVLVTLKYVLIIMRADNRGEGGSLALLSLVIENAKGNPRLTWVISLLGIFAAALFYGDSMITPAISVLSAVEGLEIVTPALKPLRDPDHAGHHHRPVLHPETRHRRGRHVLRPGHGRLVRHPRRARRA